MGLRTQARRVIRHQFRERGWRLPGSVLLGDERFMRKVAKTLKKTDIAFDLGAHIGICSLEFSYYADRVYAFEPHPQNFEILAQNAKKRPNIEPINKAVSDTTGTMKLYFEEPLKEGGHFEGATLMTNKANISYEHAFEVETVALADFIDELNKPVALIKMDIEGAEYSVIEALIERPAIERVGKIFVEDHCDRIAGLADQRKRVEARIAALGLSDRFDFTWP